MQPFHQCESKDRVHGKLLRELKLKSFAQVESAQYRAGCALMLFRHNGTQRSERKEIPRVCGKGKRDLCEGVNVARATSPGSRISNLSGFAQCGFDNRVVNPITFLPDLF